MFAGPAIATAAGGLVAVVLFICAFVVLKQVSSRESCVQRRGTRTLISRAVVKSPRSPLTSGTRNSISSWLAGTPRNERHSSVRPPSSSHSACRNAGPALIRLNMAPSPPFAVDTPAIVEIGSGEFPSGDDSHWQYPSRETGTGENWSIGTASFVFNPADFVISGDTIGDTIFEDTSEPTSYLDRWCQGYGRVLSWVGESAGVLGVAEGVQDRPKSPMERRAEAEAVSERDLKGGWMKDSRKGRNSSTDDPTLHPNVEGDESPLSSSAPVDFECDLNDDDNSGWGSDSTGDYETFLVSMEGASCPIVAQGDVWLPPELGDFTLPKKLRTCPADFSFDDPISCFEPLSAGWGQSRTLSPIFEEPEEAPSTCITVECQESSSEVLSFTESGGPSPANEQGGELNFVPPPASTSDSNDTPSEETDAEHGADTISTWPSQELSLRQLAGDSEDFWLEEPSKPSCRIIQSGIQSKLQNASESINNCDDEGSSASTCSLSSMDDMDLYTHDTEPTIKVQSPTWVDNCLFDVVGKKGHRTRA